MGDLVSIILYRSIVLVLSLFGSIVLKELWMPGWQEAGSTVFGICSHCCYYLFTKPCLTFCDPMDCNSKTFISMGFARQEYCSELPFSFSGNLPDPDIEPISSDWQVDCLALSHQGSYANFDKCQLHFPNCPFLYDSRLDLAKCSKIDIDGRCCCNPWALLLIWVSLWIVTAESGVLLAPESFPSLALWFPGQA